MITDINKTNLLWMPALSLLLWVGCQANETPHGELRCLVDAVFGSEDDVTGKWQLIKGEIFSSISNEIQVDDYSCDNIFYYFQTGGKLTIRSDVESYIGHQVGEFAYGIISESEEENGKQTHTLQIDDCVYLIEMSASHLTINVNPIDPLALYIYELKYYFVRVE